MRLSPHYFHLLMVCFLISCGILNIFAPTTYKIFSGLWLTFFAPGFATLFFLSRKPITFIDRSILSIGLSLSIIMIYGLVSSSIRQFIPIKTPLHHDEVLIFLLVFTLTLHFLASLRSNKQKLHIEIQPQIFSISIFFLILPIFTAVGAFQLNNQTQTLIPTMMLCVYPLLSFFFLFFRKKPLFQQVTPLFIFSFAVSLMWALSLRSWHISGFDISTEYKVFSLTKSLGFWDIQTFRNAYNACLSITILPTVISNLVPLPQEYIFKLIYPLIFALVPVIIYRIWSEKLGYLEGILSSIFFMSFPWFIDPLTTILRQQIAFLYFALLMFILLNINLPKPVRFCCFYLFTATLVFSHYSTTYATILMFGFSYGVGLFFSILKCIPFIKTWIKNRTFPILGNTFKDISLINPIFLIYFCCISYVWYAVFTGTSQNIKDLFHKTYESIQSPDKNLYSGMIGEIKSLFGKKTTVNLYQAYQAEKVKQFSTKYPTEKVNMERAEVLPRSAETNPIVNGPLNQFASRVFRYLSLFAAVLSPIAGLVAIFGFKIKKLEDQRWLSLMWSSVYIIIGAILVVPYISLGYNFERIFMQSMLLTAVSPALIAFLFRQRIKTYRFIYTSFFSLILLFYTFNYGLVWQIVGGKTVMWLNNKGISYDLTYTHTGEVAAADFIKKKGSLENIYTSSKGRNILTAYMNPKSISPETLSLLVLRGSYIFAHHVNTTQQMDYFSWSGSQAAFTFQKEDFDHRFNMVYSNKSAHIYK